MDRRVLTLFGAVAILAFALGGAALIVSCSTQTNESSQVAESSQSAEDTQTNEAANEPVSDQGDEVPQEARGHEEELAVVLRISGTQGTSYHGTYTVLPEGQQLKPLSIDGTLDEPYIDYEVEGNAEDFGGVQAVFQKTQPGDEGTLKVQLLSDRLLAENKTSALEGYKVLAENETSEEDGVIEVSWFP